MRKFSSFTDCFGHDHQVAFPSCAQIQRANVFCYAAGCSIGRVIDAFEDETDVFLTVEVMDPIGYFTVEWSKHEEYMECKGCALL